MNPWLSWLVARLKSDDARWLGRLREPPCRVAELTDGEPSGPALLTSAMGQIYDRRSRILPRKAAASNDLGSVSSQDLMSRIGLVKWMRVRGLIFAERTEALALLSCEGNLVKYPFLIGDEGALVGFDEMAWVEVLQKQ